MAVTLLFYFGVGGWYWHFLPAGLGAQLPASPSGCPGPQRRASPSSWSHHWLCERWTELRCSPESTISLFVSVSQGTMSTRCDRSCALPPAPHPGGSVIGGPGQQL